MKKGIIKAVGQNASFVIPFVIHGCLPKLQVGKIIGIDGEMVSFFLLDAQNNWTSKFWHHNLLSKVKVISDYAEWRRLCRMVRTRHHKQFGAKS